MIKVYCTTEKAILLLGCESEEGPMRFPRNNEEFPGLLMPVNTQIGINEQLLKEASDYLGHPAVSRHVEINQEYHEVFQSKDGIAISLYVGTLHFRHQLSKPEWPTLPEIMRTMPKDASRVPYVKAWQILAGAYREEVRAISVEEALKFFGE